MAFELKKVLVEKNLKQNKIARMLDIDQAIFNRWVNEKERIPETYQKNLIQILDLPKRFFNNKQNGAA